MSAPFGSLETMLAAAGEALLPPLRMSVIKAAEDHRYVNNQVYTGPYRSDETPYAVEPCNVMGESQYKSVIFVGPAQTGKTEMVFNLLNHTAICSPRDMLIIEKSQSSARDFSIRRLKKFIRETPEIQARVMPGRHNQSIYNVLFRNGMIVTMSWPTVNELSGRPIGVLWLSDYDRMPEDVGGEGAPYDLARKRATTFGRFQMTVAESSPSKIVTNPKWKPSTPHEAPPCGGILALYNRGDRRRWMWQCTSGCEEWFEPDFNLLRAGKTDGTPSQRAVGTIMICPHCGQIYEHDGDEKAGTPGKRELNARGRWVADGQWLDRDGVIQGEKISPSETASFWLKGPAARFTDWRTLMERYLVAMAEYEATGDDSALKTTVNTDQGLPYTAPSKGQSKAPEEMMARAHAMGHKVVPRGVRYLVAAVDTQANRWEVQVLGFGVQGETWVIDRFPVKKSRRIDEEGHPYPVQPASWLEDWDILVDEVVTKTYPLEDDSGRRMAIKMTGVDSGGVSGVTGNAYEWWRNLRKDPRGLQRRVLLLKGEPRNAAPLVDIRFPDGHRKDRHAAAAGEVPVLFICNTKVKDMAAALLDRDRPGPGYVHFPDWLPDWWYAELTCEERGKERWEKANGARNEAWDLLCYAYGLNACPKIGGDRINWADPPDWAGAWDINPLCISAEVKMPFENQDESDYTLANLAAALA